ncbi:hypothetical protein Verru16b_00680 [Lacunisphaera limnophila]|uniref:Uncharacterized protein n=2 Tax=Lacunisphaera limnophila TaxID=1838286 RepID=A0A1D8ARV5_9BACT|nr:hypothetical protein Verru16b_00680 [Lacunisphaera limnophila]
MYDRFASAFGSWARSGILAGACLVMPLLAAAEKPPGAAPVAPGFLDRFQQGFAHTLDQSSRWVDGLFGEERYTNAGKGANGQLQVRTLWQEYQGIRVRTQLRANLPLAQLSHRLNAFIGKGGTDDIVQDKNQSPTGSSDPKDNSWLVGLGYTPPWSHAQRVTLQAGAILRWPPDAYVRANYHYQHAFAPGQTVTFSESVFWKESEQFGCSSSLDFAWQLRDDLVLRFPNWAKISDATSGVQYDSRAHLYQKLGNHRALLYGVGLQGDTRDAVPVRQYGAYVVYRQRMFRDWLTGELIAGATMLRENGWSRRKLSTIVGVGFEMAFEEKHDATGSVLSDRLLRSPQ